MKIFSKRVNRKIHSETQRTVDGIVCLTHGGFTDRLGRYPKNRMDKPWAWCEGCAQIMVRRYNELR